MIESLRRFFDGLIANGYRPELSNDDIRRIRAVNLVSLMLLVALFAFIVIDLYIFHDYYVAVVEILGLVCGIYYLLVQRFIKSVTLITNSATAIMTVALIAISITQGIGNSTTFWLFLIPPFAFFVGGLLSGFIWSGIMIFYVGVMIVLSELQIFGAELSPEFPTDALFASLTVTLLSAFYEFARRRATRELSDTNDEMRRLIYVVSHDLRTPLTALRGYVSFLKEDLVSQPDQRANEDIEKIDLIANNMGRMIDDLLNLSRIGRKVDERQVVNAREVVDLVLTENEARINERGIRTEVIEPLPRLFTHRRKFEEVIRNLVSNAIKYMGEQPSPLIKIGVYDNPHEYHFYVQDNGIGIDRKDFGKMFQMFSRLTTIGEGSGIGLSIVKGFVTDMGGAVWIDSKLGLGSTFWFSIPKADPPGNQPQDLRV